MTALTATGVRKAFGDEAALRGLDLTVDEGEIVLLMGPNGAGKSVLTSCLAAATEPDAGSIELLDGRSPAEARGLTGLLLQGELLDPKLTGRENLRFRQRLHPRGTDEWAALAERFEVAGDLDRVVGDYSGGMRQKVELLAALSADVPLYLLDEPASALDLSTLRVLHDELLSLRADGRTVVLTSHTPLDAQIADRLVFLRDGRAVAAGAPDELLAALPDVVRVRGAVPDEELLLGGRSFRRGDEVRGFLPEGTSASDVEDALDGRSADEPGDRSSDAPGDRSGDAPGDRSGDALVDVDPPSFTDLFNYYAAVDGADGAATDRTEVVAGARNDD